MDAKLEQSATLSTVPGTSLSDHNLNFVDSLREGDAAPLIKHKISAGGT
jgi:hypothetical protein